MISFVWVIMVALSILCAAATGRTGVLTNAAVEGANTAVTLGISLCGMICLWSGIMEVMKRSGISLSKPLAPVLSRLFPEADKQAMEAISANVSANLLGLGNAATPPGLAAAKRLQELSKRGNTAGDGFAMLVVINTASLQLIPVTVASLRASNGAAAPFDILPGVWLSSAVGVAAAVICARFFAKSGGRL